MQYAICNMLNEITKDEIFTQGFEDWRKIKRKVSHNLDNLPNLLIKLTVKASAEKVWLSYEFQFSFNPGYNKKWCTDMKNCLSLYLVSRRLGQSKFKKKLMGHFRDNKIKSTKH